MSGHMDGGDQPVSQRESRKQPEGAPCRAKTLLSPANVGETEVMPPVIRFERDGAAGRRQRVHVAPGAIEDESECCPRLTVVWCKATGFT